MTFTLRDYLGWCLRRLLSGHLQRHYRWQLRWYLRLLGREVFRGFAYSGSGVIAPAAVEYVLLTSAGAHLDGPPPGHPERLVPGRPLSARERALWAQLSN
jgi:hypothetical protein